MSEALNAFVSGVTGGAFGSVCVLMLHALWLRRRRKVDDDEC